MPSPRVLCFGEALVDRLGPPGDDPGQPPSANQAVEDRLGGAPANAACALARLGTPVAFLGRLGEDAIGAAFAALFQERRVDDSAVQWDAQRPSRTVLVRRERSGERRFGGFAGDRGQGFADQAVEAGPLVAAATPLLKAAPWLLVGTLPLASPASAQALQALVSLAEQHRAPVAVDVNWRPTFWGLDPEAAPPASARQRILPLLERASLIKCAAEEALWLFGSADAGTVQAALPQRPAVLVTDGPGPIRWATASGQGQLPSTPVPVVDTTGAGDAFVAGLLHQLARQPRLLSAATLRPELEAALRFAGACGALVCQGAGAIDPQPSAAAVQALLQTGTAAPAADA